MRTYKIKGKEHHIYDLESELPDGISINTDWKNARRGDWVLADDGAYVQILERKKIGTGDIVQTCVGTYSTKRAMDTSERESRYTINGKHPDTLLKERKVPTFREKLFANKVAKGRKAIDAYLEVYDTNSRKHAKRRAALLLRTERVITLMNENEDLKKVFAELGVDLDYLIKSCKSEIDNGKNGSDRLNALKMMWEAFGVVPEKKKATEITGIFQGFEPSQLEEIKRPVLPEGKNRDDSI